INIVDVSCSEDHVVAICSQGRAYAWGRNRHGKLGVKLGPDSTVRKPTRVCLPDTVRLKQVVCGPDATAFLDHSHQLWLCGNNQFNMLALNRFGFFNYSQIPYATVPQQPSLKKAKVRQISLGHTHSVFTCDTSTVVATGCNEKGQLGLRHTKAVGRPKRVAL